MKLSNIQNFINAAESLADEYNFNLSESIVTFGPDSLTISFPDGTCTVEITYTDTTSTLATQAKESDGELNVVYHLEELMQRILEWKKTATGRVLEELECAEQHLDDVICSVNSIE